MMKITMNDGTEVSFSDHLDKKGVKSQIQETLGKNIDKGRSAKPMQKAMPEALDRKKRVGVDKPSRQTSKAQQNMAKSWPSPNDVTNYFDGK